MWYISERSSKRRPPLPAHPHHTPTVSRELTASRPLGSGGSGVQPGGRTGGSGVQAGGRFRRPLGSGGPLVQAVQACPKEIEGGLHGVVGSHERGVGE